MLSSNFFGIATIEFPLRYTWGSTPPMKTSRIYPSNVETFEVSMIFFQHTIFVPVE